jgi:hypothetical protein
MQASSLVLKKGDTLVLTLRSGNADKKTLTKMRKQLKKQFPNNKVAIFGIGIEDDLALTTISKGEK